MSNAEVIDKILSRFYKTMFKILKISKTVEPNNKDIERVSNIISVARDQVPTLVIDKSKDIIWEYRHEIIDEDADFFLNNSFKKNMVDDDDEDKEFIISLITVIKKRFREFEEVEKKEIWRLIKSLLKSVAEYKKATGDYET